MTDTAESISELFTLRTGDEIRVQGKWLEVQRIQPVNPCRLLVKTYDPNLNAERTFAADSYLEYRMRQPVATIA